MDEYFTPRFECCCHIVHRELLHSPHHAANDRDKLICILNAARALAVHVAAKGAGADEMLPLLIVALLRANPRRLRSHVTYIGRYRREAGLMTEPGYYYTQLLSAITFLERCDHRSLSISLEEWNRHMSPPPSTAVATVTPPLLDLDIPMSCELSMPLCVRLCVCLSSRESRSNQFFVLRSQPKRYCRVCQRTRQVFDLQCRAIVDGRCV
jgi:hypothetical protein